MLFIKKLCRREIFFFWRTDERIKTHVCVYTGACTYVHTTLIPTTVVLLVQILALPLRSSVTLSESLHFLASQICHWWNSDPISYPSVSSWGLNHRENWHIWLMLLWWHLYFARCLFPMSLERTKDAQLRAAKHQCSSLAVRGTDLPASHLAYSSVLSHKMMGNRPEKPWGKSTAEVGFQFSLYICSNT